MLTSSVNKRFVFVPGGGMEGRVGGGGGGSGCGVSGWM